MPKKPVIISLAILIAVGAALVHFTRKHTVDEALANRAEGRSLGSNMKNSASYLMKYFLKRKEAPEQVMKFFREQESSAYNGIGECSSGQGGRLAFVGDVMWIRDNWDHFLDDSVKSYLEKMDMVFGNLETPIDTTRAVRSFFPDYFSYNSSPGLINSFMKSDGSGNIFTALSLANNHALDRGTEGFTNTKAFLSARGIAFSGDESGGVDDSAYCRLELNGITIGFYAAAWGLNDPDRNGDHYINIIPGLAPPDPGKADTGKLKAILEKMARDGIDIRILSLHWGFEYELYPDTMIMRIARGLAADGADIIIGSHPHVVQPSEVYYPGATGENAEYSQGQPSPAEGISNGGAVRKSLIIYSLGNFTTAMYTPLCRLGGIISVDLFRDSLTGRAGWCCPVTSYVYNTQDDPVSGERKLMEWNTFIEGMESKSPRRAEKIRQDVSQVMGSFTE